VKRVGLVVLAAAVLPLLFRSPARAGRLAADLHQAPLSQAADAAPATGASRPARGAVRLIALLRSAAWSNGASLDDLDFVRVVRRVEPLRTVVLQVVAGSGGDALAHLRADPRVESVAGDAEIHTEIEPNDRAFSRQWALQMIQAPLAWELNQGSADVTVAVLDSGIDLTHPDLAQHVLPIGCNLIEDQVCTPNGHGTPPIDQEGHGSHVAGIVAAATNNGEGIAGIAWNASLLPVRITSDGKGLESDFITGVVWAVDHGARVLNFSFSEDCGVPESPALRDALNYAWNQGAVLVGAAGNGAGCPAGVYPAADPHVIAVASTDMNDAPSSFSNFGPWVAAAAPGEQILSTWSHGQYSMGSGTSMAAPQVSGLAALLFATPGATNTDVVNWILATCDVPEKWNHAYGCGRINAFRAVYLAQRGIDPHTSSTDPVRVHLQPGFNNLLYLGATRQVDTALASLRGKYTSIYAWDPLRATWSTYLPNQPAASDLQLLQERSAYWLYMRTDADLVMTPSGTDGPPLLTLAAGWNNLALPAGKLPAILKSFIGSISSVFAWNAPASTWQGYFPEFSSISDINSVRADGAYWVYASRPVALHYRP